MKFTIDTNDLSADQFGETLRDYFFTKSKGVGCYSNFETESFLIEGVMYHEAAKKYFGECEYPPKFFADKKNFNIWLAWYWDGDGTLVVSDGNRIAVNHDCKCYHGWKFVK